MNIKKLLFTFTFVLMLCVGVCHAEDVNVNLSVSYGNAPNIENIMINGSDITVKATVENITSADEDVSVVIGFYDKLGRLSGVKVFCEKLSEKSPELTKKITLPDDENIVSAKLFALKSSETLQPYADSILCMTTIGNDMYGNSAESAYAVEEGGSIAGRINYVSDIDCFSFTAENSFDSDLSITGDAKFEVYTSDGEKVTPVDKIFSFKAGVTYIVKVFGEDEDTPYYTFSINKPSAVIGAEFEQKTSKLENLVPPSINDAEVEVLNFITGKYKITLKPEMCSYDSRADGIFFFWNSRDGVTSDYKLNPDGSVSFVFTSNPDKALARIVIGFGDGLGQADRKALLLKGFNKGGDLK